MKQGMYNEICPLHLIHPSRLLGQSINRCWQSAQEPVSRHRARLMVRITCWRIDQMYMLLAPEETHPDTGRNMQTPHGLGIEPTTKNTNRSATMPP